MTASQAVVSASIAESPPSYATALDALESVLHILDRFNHRHKNQHRVAKWWAAFDGLRRALRRLEDSIRSHEERRSKLAALSSSSRKKTSTSGARTKAAATALQERQHAVLARAEWVDQHVLPSSYIAFSQLAADQQHAPLGLLLIGLTARTKSAVLTPLLPSAGLSHPDPPAATNSANLDPTTKPSHAEGAKGRDHHSSSSLDLGVAVSRDDLTPSPQPSSRDTSKRAGPTLQGGKQDEEFNPNPVMDRSPTTAEKTTSERFGQSRPSTASCPGPPSPSPSSPLPRSGSSKRSVASAEQPADPRDPPPPSKKKKKKTKTKTKDGDEFADLFGSLL